MMSLNPYNEKGISPLPILDIDDYVLQKMEQNRSDFQKLPLYGSLVYHKMK